MAKKFYANLQLQGQSRLSFADADSTNVVAFRAPATVSSDVLWTLPAADSTGTQTLVSDGAGTLSFSNFASSVNGLSGTVVLDTDDIGEGATNLYYTEARFDASFSGKSTTDLAEGTNLYFTDARAVDAIEAVSLVTLDPANDEVIILDATDGVLKKVAASELAGVTKVSFDIANTDTFPLALSHNLGTRDVQVQIYDAASPYDTIILDSVERTDVNTVTVNPVGAPASFTWRVVVIG